MKKYFYVLTICCVIRQSLCMRQLVRLNSVLQHLSAADQRIKRVCEYTIADDKDLERNIAINLAMSKKAIDAFSVAEVKITIPTTNIKNLFDTLSTIIDKQILPASAKIECNTDYVEILFKLSQEKSKR